MVALDCEGLLGHVHPVERSRNKTCSRMYLRSIAEFLLNVVGIMMAIHIVKPCVNSTVHVQL